MKSFYQSKIAEILNLFPEVTWDRWSGQFHAMGVFGWIPREDGKQDFFSLRIINGKAVQMTTSSAKYSAIFAARLDFGHSDCKRVEHDFPHVKALCA